MKYPGRPMDKLVLFWVNWRPMIIESPRVSPGPGPRWAKVCVVDAAAARALGPGPGPFAKLLNEFVSQRSYFLLASLNYLMNLFLGGAISY